VNRLKTWVTAGLMSLAIALPAFAHPPVPLRGKDAIIQTILERYPYIVENPGGRVLYVLIPVNDLWGEKLQRLWPQANKEGLEIRWVNILSEKAPTNADLNFIAETNLKRDLTAMQRWYSLPRSSSPSSLITTPEAKKALQQFRELEQTIRPRVIRHGTLYHYPALLWLDDKGMIYYSSAAFPENLAELQLILDDVRLNQQNWREFTENPAHHHH
jgi:hypothetical protein